MTGASFTGTTTMPMVLAAVEIGVDPPLLLVSNVTRVSVVPSNVAKPPV